MNVRHSTTLRTAGAMLCIAAGLACSPAHAGDKPASASAEARHRQEVAVCTSGQSNQPRDVCLREAAAAYAEAKRGELNDGNTTYQLNAVKRCQPLPPDDRAACLARMHGEGSVSGSVAEGGVLRELVTVEPGPVSALVIVPQPLQPDHK